MSQIKNYILGIVTGVVITSIIILAILVGYYGLSGLSRKNSHSEVKEASYDHLEAKLQEIEEALEESYYEDFDEEALYEKAVEGFVEGVGDPYTSYFTKEEYKDFTEGIDGTYEGIGAYVDYGETKDELLIVAPMDGSPSEQAGLEAMDRIMKVDDVQVSGLSIEELVRLIKGPKGSKVRMTIRRDGKEQEIVVTRAKIEVPTIKHEMLDHQIGYIRISGFDGVTYDQFMEAYKELEAEEEKGLIIDLRYNGGGLTQIVSAIADELLPEGIIYTIQDKNGKEEVIKSDEAHQFNKPLVVLVNGASASASEILAGAIKDHERGIIVGTTTFGKGLVQSGKVLEDGSFIKITIAKYFTPDGHYIHKKGIEPDVLAEIPEVDEKDRENLPDDWDPQLDVAIEEMEKLINK